MPMIADTFHLGPMTGSPIEIADTLRASSEASALPDMDSPTFLRNVVGNVLQCGGDDAVNLYMLAVPKPMAARFLAILEEDTDLRPELDIDADRILLLIQRDLAERQLQAYDLWKRHPHLAR